MRISSQYKWSLGLLAGVSLLTACAGSPTAGGMGATGASNPLLPQAAERSGRRPIDLGSVAISHVVIIIQENRSVDDLFNALPGADTAHAGRNAANQSVPLAPELLTAP
ncbi:MAG TPA: hypothetical protein VGG51_11020 [Candidatus Cybelea sp.]|jgi:phospholipase C